VQKNIYLPIKGVEKHITLIITDGLLKVLKKTKQKESV